MYHLVEEVTICPRFKYKDRVGCNGSATHKRGQSDLR